MLISSKLNDQDNRGDIVKNDVKLAERPTSEVSPNSFLHGFTLANFLQYVEMDEKSWTLHILSKDKSGVLHFRDGHLLDAYIDGKNGEEAALEILSWDQVDINVEDDCRIDNSESNLSLKYLLFEAARLMDENT